jgi:hypothetical protein
MGGAGTYNVYAVAGAGPGFTLTALSGAGPTNSRKIGEAVWNGSAITTLRQLVDAVPGHGQSHALGGTDPLPAGSVDANVVAATLKPSEGAAAGTETLRALGTTSSTAAAGNDARLSDVRTPADDSVTAAKVNTALKGGAAAGTEALRALGTTSTTACAGDDARLSNQRTPSDDSVTAAKINTALKGGAAAGTEALRALGTTATTAAAGNDARLSDTRTPTDDSVTAAKVNSALKGGAAAGTEALRALGTTATTAAAGNDSRLSDTRTPTDDSVTAAKVNSTLKGGAAAGTEALRALGTTATTACAGNDSRLTNPRDPNAHAASHAPGAADAIRVDGSGTYAARPAAGTVGRYYFANDIGDAGILFRDNGSAWREVNGARLGSLDWFYPLGGTSAPFTAPWGYAIMDGTAWASIPNHLGYSSGNIPNLIDAHVTGADPTKAFGTAGTLTTSTGATVAPGAGGLTPASGSANASNGNGGKTAVTTATQSATTTGAASNSTTSSVNLDHAHTIAYGGDHSHGGNTGNGTDYQIVANNSAGTTAPHYDHKHTISSDGSHNHGGGTGWMDSHQDHSHTMAHTHDFTHTHTSDAGTFDLRAKSVGLVPCMKVLYY